MKRIMLWFFVALLLPLATGAQQSSKSATQPSKQATVQPETNPVSNAVRKIMERRAKIMIAAAEAMPADKYGFRPTPEQMTFGHLVVHTAGANNFLCSSIAGTAASADEKLIETDSKEKLVAALRASFDYCAQALAKIDDSKLADQVPFFGGDMISRAGAMIALTDVAYDHYSMAAMYLRLNGLVPPSAQPKKE
jgi:DNA replication initiation complex subunit (GINS family)